MGTPTTLYSLLLLEKENKKTNRRPNCMYKICTKSAEKKRRNEERAAQEAAAAAKNRHKIKLRPKVEFEEE